MVLAELIEEVKSLGPDERLRLMGELWDSFDPEGLPVSAVEVRLVQERALRLEAHPRDEMDWDEFEALVDALLA